MNLSDGYDTEVGNAGSLLSGGQRARIALARALVKKPSVLLLDEVTAALDQESETNVVETLKKLSDTTSIIVITHSELLMRACNKIYVVENGGLLASGSYEELSSSSLFLQTQNLNLKPA